ncbi:uncharacterized protein LOC124138700 [Haliotis rufescens]|uniref:uncharacterized protein LOC124138700 n=1 Tax=Haliotis rufescens TaxID=6454 RepID=UPI001EB09408|nr:uncharacterized protein LOC124138700 [Haliotis rufescens]
MRTYGILIFNAALLLVCGKQIVFEYTCFSYTIKDENNQAVQIRCNSTEVFSPVDGKCIKPEKNKWPCGKDIDCHTKADQKYADTKEGCKTYYTCLGGVFFGHNYCPGVLVFNEKYQYCDWDYNVEPPCGTHVDVIG